MDTSVEQCKADAMEEEDKVEQKEAEVKSCQAKVDELAKEPSKVGSKEEQLATEALTNAKQALEGAMKVRDNALEKMHMALERFAKEQKQQCKLEHDVGGHLWPERSLSATAVTRSRPWRTLVQWHTDPFHVRCCLTQNLGSIDDAEILEPFHLFPESWSIHEVMQCFNKSRERHPEWGIPKRWIMSSTNDFWNLFALVGYATRTLSHGFIRIVVEQEEVPVLRPGFNATRNTMHNCKDLWGKPLDFSGRREMFRIPAFVFKVFDEHYYQPLKHRAAHCTNVDCDKPTISPKASSLSCGCGRRVHEACMTEAEDMLFQERGDFVCPACTE